MYCYHCGASIPDDANICPKCGCSTGKKEENEIKQSETNAKRTGIFALCFCWVPIVGIILGVRCIISDKTGKHKAKGIIAICLSIAFALAISFMSGYLKG